MKGHYLGRLSQADPFYQYVQTHILPQLNVTLPCEHFRVFQFTYSQAVFLYEEVHGRTCFVAKFEPKSRKAALRHSPANVQTEYNNLIHVRSLGFDAPPHYVVRPLGFNPGTGNVLALEYLEGAPLHAVIADAIHNGQRDRLYRKLSALAHFLAKLHNRTVGEYRVDHEDTHAYAGRLINSLEVKRGMGRSDAEELYRLRDKWRTRPCMWEDRSVLVHGDATPSNFLFGDGRRVLAIDFERMKWADRVFDLGRLCGELKHFFFQATGSPHAAEPFIGHFLWEYCHHFPDQRETFAAVTRRIPFHIGITLLRIARNSWIDWDYRWRLVREAKTVLGAKA